MTPSCPSSRRKSLGRWRKLTEIWRREDSRIAKKIMGGGSDRKRTLCSDGNSAARRKT